MLGNLYGRIYNFFTPDSGLVKNKEKWENLGNKGIGVSNLPRDDKETREWGKQEYAKLITNDANVPKGGIALDLGCGIGRLSEFMANDYETVYGTDISSAYIERATKRVPNVIFYETDGESIPLPDGHVDFVLSQAVFQLMPTYQAVKNNLLEMHRVMKSGARAKLNFRGNLVTKDKWFYGYSFKKEELLNLIFEVGFKVVSFKYDGKHFWAILEK